MLKTRHPLLAVALLAAVTLGLATAPANGADTPPAAPVDINAASEEQLKEVPGIGEATARKIIANRPYKSLDELAKTGIPAKTLDKLKPMLKVGGGAPSAPAAPAAAAPAPAPAKPAARAAAAPAAAKPAAPSAQAQAPPAKGMVWVNLPSKVFHREDDRWYGKTKEGKYMTEEEAIKAGYTESKSKVGKKQ